jgi:hypothetical protein
MVGRAAVLVSHGRLPDSGCRSSSLHQKQGRLRSYGRCLVALYNTVHPHKALGYRSPREFRKQLVKERTEARSALRVDRMTAPCPRMRSGQARQPRAARRREASGLTRAQPWTNRNSHSLSGYSGATTDDWAT